MTFRSVIITALLALAAAACGGSPTQPAPTPNPTPAPNTNPPPDPAPTPPPPTFAVTKVMAFGDSLTEGESKGTLFGPGMHDHGTPGVSTSYPFKLQATLAGIYTSQTINVFNSGKGGEFVVGSGAKDRLLTELGAYQPQVVLLLHGVNNVNKVIDPEPMSTIVASMDELVKLINARGAHVMLATLPPQMPTAKATGGARIAQFNDEMRKLAALRGATLVDVHPQIDAQTMLTVDGLHLNETGNARLAALFYAALKTKYHRDPP